MAAPALRPLSAGEVLDLSFGIYRRLFASLVMLQVACMGVPFLLNIYVVATGAQLSPVVWLSYLLSFILSALASAATAKAISAAYLDRPLTAMEALRQAVPRLGPLLLLSILIGLLLVVSALPFLVLFGGATYTMAARAGGGSGAGVGFAAVMMIAGIGFLVLPLLVGSGISVATPAVVLEDRLTATEALARAWFLTKGFRLRIAGLLLVAIVLIMLPYMAIGALAAVFSQGGGAATPTSLALWITAASLVGRLLITPVLYCLITLLYYDLRVRKEGFDLEMLSAALQPA